MFKSVVKAKEGKAPYNIYDSLLEVPSGKNPNQNAWLTLQLRIELNFVDSKHPAKGSRKNDLIVKKPDGKFYAKDGNGYLFPILDWPIHFKEKFKTQFQKHAEKVWNWQFVLITPKTYAQLDVQNLDGQGWLIRPNVLCLFRLELATSDVHRTINVVNLDFRTKEVANADTAAHPTPKKITKPFDAGTWRSDASDYDDSDLFRPYVWDAKNHVMHDTIGHEIGHALGQAHILPLKGDLTCKTPKEGTNARDCYGKKPEDQWNIMGGGDRIYLINAVSWKERIALHTAPTTPADWGVTGMMNTPPRKVALGASLIGTPTF